MKKAKILLQILLSIIILCSISYICYQQNWFDVHNKIVQEIRSHKVVVDDNKKMSLAGRNRIRQRLMRETQAGLKSKDLLVYLLLVFLSLFLMMLIQKKVCKQVQIMQIVAR